MFRSSALAIAAFSCLVLTIGAEEKPSNSAPATTPEPVQFPVEVPAVNLQTQRALAQARLLGPNPGTRLFKNPADKVTRVYGRAFSHGQSPVHSAEQFRTEHSMIWGVPAEDLVLGGPFEDRQQTLPIVFDPATGQYKFTGVYYTQMRDGVPVFGGRMMALVRNQADSPMVLATAELRELGDFQVDQKLVANPNVEPAFGWARKRLGEQAVLSQPQVVIWAGTEDVAVDPMLAFTFEAEAGPANAYEKWLFIADAQNGRKLYEESLVYHGGVGGTVKGLATQGHTASACASTTQSPMPYARVVSGADIIYANEDGDYDMQTVGGSGPMSLESSIRGIYFRVSNQAGDDASLLETATPPAAVDFLHAAIDTNEFTRAEVDAYIHANRVRDHVLQYNPAYPTVNTQTDFLVRVNIDANCNAYYNGNSINFYTSGRNCNNTAISSVVYHEYGHHLVNTGGSGQGAYGEGMSDCIALLITDSPLLGVGFSSCSNGIRNANNDCQYQTSGCSSCGSAVHACGRLLSGCVWSTRNQLLATNPSTFRDILATLTINSILLHNGSTITPAITVDFLTLDDDNDDIGDGTPHYYEIATGFGDHNMPAPAILDLRIEYPNGRPQFISPTGTTTMRVHVLPVAAQPQPGSALLHLSNGGPFTAYPMIQISPNVYDAVFPASSCASLGTSVQYYVSALATNGVEQLSPVAAPLESFNAIAASGLGDVIFHDDFNTNQGWQVDNPPPFPGGWERGIPITNCNRGNPLIDGDGSSWCFLTENSSANNCNSDVDGGATTLTSPVLDASAGACVLSYWRWYSNTQGNAPHADIFVIEVSDNGGATWLPLETVGPTDTSANPEVDGGWHQRSFSLAAVPGLSLTNQFRVRFVASDLGNGSVVEAAIDGVKLQKLLCASPGLGDVNSDGFVNVDDLLILLASWGPCPAPVCPADLNSNNIVDVDDLLLLLSHWG